MEVEAENVRVYWVSDWLIWGRGLAIGQLDTREVIAYYGITVKVMQSLTWTIL